MSNLSNILTERYVMNMLHTIHDAIEECYDDTGRPLLKLQGYLNTVTRMIQNGDIDSVMIKDGSITADKLSADLINRIMNVNVIEEDGQKYRVTIDDEGNATFTPYTTGPYTISGKKLTDNGSGSKVSGKKLTFDDSVAVVDQMVILK